MLTSLGEPFLLNNRFLDPFSLGVWMSVVLAGCVSAHIMWLMERHRNPEEFPEDYFNGMKESFYVPSFH